MECLLLYERFDKRGGNLGGPSPRTSALEFVLRDCEEIVGAGQQQVRFLGANVGAFHICMWTFTMTKAWAWGREAEELVNRADSQWDSPSRRPRHTDKRRAWRGARLAEETWAVRQLRPGVTEGEIQGAADRLLSLVT